MRLGVDALANSIALQSHQTNLFWERSALPKSRHPSLIPIQAYDGFAKYIPYSARRFEAMIRSSKEKWFDYQRFN